MTYEEFWHPLTGIYEAGEAKAVARLVLEKRFGIWLADIVCGKTETADEQELLAVQQQLLKGQPVQYVLGEADFGPRTFGVGKGVLIPRPETYELCQWAVADFKDQARSLDILDIGTGSGCIACTLAAELPQGSVTAWDLYDDALAKARENAARLGLRVTLERVDALSPPPAAGRWDIIVSNPPYICRNEQAAMAGNVVDFEPHTALFVPDDDPLLFYRSIARYAASALRPGGALYLELNPLYAGALRDLLQSAGLERAGLATDQFGKTRFARAWKAEKR